MFNVSDSLSRRELLIGAGVLAAATSTASSVSSASRADFSHDPLAGLPVEDPAFNAEVVGKLQGDLSGTQRCIYNPGFIFGVAPAGAGLPPDQFGKLLLQVEGCTLRISRRLPDGSIEERSDSWMFFCDAHTGDYLSQWRNPYTDELLDVPPFRGGPGSSKLTPMGPVLAGPLKIESTALASPVRLHWRAVGRQLWLSRHAASRITTPAGKARNEMSVDSWVCRTADVRDRRRSWIPSTYAWTSHGEWPAWFRLGSVRGNVVWRVESLLLDDAAQLPARFVDHTRRLLPGKLGAKLRFDEAATSR